MYYIAPTLPTPDHFPDVGKMVNLRRFAGCSFARTFFSLALAQREKITYVCIVIVTNTTTMTIGTVIRQRREELGWTQTFLANIADTSISTISRLERGCHTTQQTTTSKVMTALGIRATYAADARPAYAGKSRRTKRATVGAGI
jgi:DNA-binding XRE family transcriptional regulator